MSDLEKLKKAIDEHFKREMEIALMILEADLTPEELEELKRFIRDHEWSRLVWEVFEKTGHEKVLETLKKEVFDKNNEGTRTLERA